MKTKVPIATIAIIAINIAVFVLLYPYKDAIAKLYGISMMSILLFPAKILFTNMFVHAGVTHIALNMTFLAMVGWSLEKRVGTVKFLIIYFSAGILSSVISMLFVLLSNNPYITVVGASGAIFGVFVYDEISKKGLDGFYSQTMPLIAFMHFPIVFGANIAWFAHLGGIAAGILAALIMPPPSNSEEPVVDVGID